ncbi:hypothetical protein [Clostridium thermosuccinogenes]|jgi:hypothetical protein|uniref:hypothetical protein n=1 Tax=Clostridium thermosuccinogenes TaxID=84032 RepID=UPI000CCC53BE|nr:hypothetical protein [Pseudoclostridium thermosuccinogenes]PNT90889.1 hypothetical protein CDQ83_13690 [Pseudoclostridium thermosuccinogenes]
MAGIIVGYFGFQRSGKTLKAYLDAESYRQKGIEVYSNMDVPGWNKLTSLTDIPFNTQPKVVLLDEAYYFLDSRNWKNNTDSTIFFNTIGKQNILLLLTAIDPGTIELRLRNQMNYVYLVKSDKRYIYYKLIDVIRQKEKIYILEKTKELFNSITYDTNQVPDIVDCSLKDFKKKVDEYYKKQNIRII